MLHAATRHVTLPNAPCLPAARLLAAWPVTPVPTLKWGMRRWVVRLRPLVGNGCTSLADRLASCGGGGDPGTIGVGGLVLRSS
jgi:hypothetical protein